MGEKRQDVGKAERKKKPLLKRLLTYESVEREKNYAGGWNRFTRVLFLLLLIVRGIERLVLR